MTDNENKEIVVEAITSENIDNFTTSDKEAMLTRCKLTDCGFPKIWPTKTFLGKRSILSFVDVCLEGEESEPVTFDIIDDEVFDRNAKDAITKIKFLSAFLLGKPFNGAVYWKGALVLQLSYKDEKEFFKNLMTKFFHVEDADLIQKYFVTSSDYRLPYWPTKSYDGREAIFSAVNASLAAKSDPTNYVEQNINFIVWKSDLFDLTTNDDLHKVKIVRDMLNPDRLVSGFYYKGKLLPYKLSSQFKLYLEKSFIKKNFSVEDRNFLLTYITRDKKTDQPLFWPMNDKKGRPIVVSVLNANGLGVDARYSNFDLYADEKLDLNSEEVKAKLGIVQELLSGKSLVNGVLYLDGMLIPGMESKSEIERRIGKVEKALDVYISTNQDFIRISNEFTIEDRERMLRLGDQYDKYFVDNKTKIPSKLKVEAGTRIPTIKFVGVNVLDELGNYLYDTPVDMDVFDDDDSAFTNYTFISIIKDFAHPNVKVRGAIYFKGTNVNFANKNNLINALLVKNFLKYVYSKIGEENAATIKEYVNTPKYKFQVDGKYRLPVYWATKNKEGRETLLSVVDADVHFKVGRYTVKACNDINFDVYKGETLGLVGESGSGKTTITRAILGINKLTKGGIYYKGKLISGKMKASASHAMKKNIQMIFQDPAASLNERANIDYIVSEGLYNFKMFKSKEERVEKVSNMMREVGLLPEHLSRYPHEFSGGQRQRIGIARALILEPQLVLADEPISALDVSIRAQILNLLRKLQKANDITYIFIAHDLSIIRYISDRIAVMHRGYIVELGPAEEIYSHPLHPYTRSLLTAIPQPDPRSKNDRKRVPYDQGNIVYGDCSWEEFRPGHYVLVNDELREKIKARVAKIDDSKEKSVEKVAAPVEAVAEEKPAKKATKSTAKKTTKKATKKAE